MLTACIPGFIRFNIIIDICPIKVMLTISSHIWLYIVAGIIVAYSGKLLHIAIYF